eukprot:246285_1
MEPRIHRMNTTHASTTTSHHHRPPPVHMDAPQTDVKVNGQQTNTYTRSNDRTCDPCHRLKAHGITSKEDIVATKTDESKVNKAQRRIMDTLIKLNSLRWMKGY